MSCGLPSRDAPSRSPPRRPVPAERGCYVRQGSGHMPGQRHLLLDARAAWLGEQRQGGRLVLNVRASRPSRPRPTTRAAADFEPSPSLTAAFSPPLAHRPASAISSGAPTSLWASFAALPSSAWRSLLLCAQSRPASAPPVFLKTVRSALSDQRVSRRAPCAAGGSPAFSPPPFSSSGLHQQGPAATDFHVLCHAAGAITGRPAVSALHL